MYERQDILIKKCSQNKKLILNILRQMFYENLFRKNKFFSIFLIRIYIICNKIIKFDYFRYREKNNNQTKFLKGKCLIFFIIHLKYNTV